jgi:hypothetical protein
MDHYNLFSDVHAKIHKLPILGAWEARNEVVDAQYNFEGAETFVKWGERLNGLKWPLTRLLTSRSKWGFLRDVA